MCDWFIKVVTIVKCQEMPGLLKLVVRFTTSDNCLTLIQMLRKKNEAYLFFFSLTVASDS